TRLFDADHPHRIAIAQNLGRTLMRNGKLDEAEELLTDVADRASRVFGPASSELALTLGALGDLYLARGELESAADMFDETIALLTPIPTERVNLVTTTRRLASVLGRLGQTERAE